MNRCGNGSPSAANGEEQVSRVRRLEVKPELVGKPGGQVLLDDVGAAADPDVLVPGHRLGLREIRPATS